MSFEPFEILRSRTIVLPQKNIDTDQIIPARFLTTTSRKGLGKAAFYDWRYDVDGRPRNSSIFNGVDPDTHRIPSRDRISAAAHRASTRPGRFTISASAPSSARISPISSRAMR